MLKNISKNRTLSGILIGITVTTLLTIGLVAGTFHSLQEHFSDFLYTRDEPSQNIVIIAVDDKSTQPSPEGFGRFSQWTRERFTQLLTALEKEKPKVITFDFIFQTPTDTISKASLRSLSLDSAKLSNKEKLDKYENFVSTYKSSLDDPIDNAFATKLQTLDNLVLATSLHPNGESLIRPLLKFMVKARLGVVNTFLDRTGILRQSTPAFYVKEEDKFYPDLALATVEKFLEAEEIKPEDITNPESPISLTLTTPQKTIEIPLESGQMNVNFFGNPLTYPRLSFVDVVNGKFEPGFFTDKIILIGSTASKEIHDEYYTPKSNTTPMSGIEFRANEIQTILGEKFLENQTLISTILTILILSIGLTIGLNYLSILSSIFASFAALILYILAAHLFYRGGLILNLVYPVTAIVLAYFSSWIYKYFIADKSKREMTSAFAHYVSPDLVKEISKNPDMVKLGGEKRVVTVFFSDIKDSTAHAEKVAPEVWVAQVNEYFTAMEMVVKNFGGTLDKYEGDAIMAFWNAPIAQVDHIARAYGAALEMQKVLGGLRGKWACEGKPLIEIRIGINTGEALVGNFGSSSRFDYTVMGDTVNTASRLESSANKSYGTSIMVAGFESARADQQSVNPSPGTTPQISTSQINNLSQNFLLRELDTVLLPGKKEPVVLYELMTQPAQATESVPSQSQFPSSALPSLNSPAIISTYASGLAAYRKKDFSTAIKFFESLPADKPSQIMLSRCQKFAAESANNSAQKIPELNEQMIFRILNK